MVQNILQALGSDQINSISDTPEALQIAEIIRSTYYNMLGRSELPEHRKLFQLGSPTNMATPVIMTSPADGVLSVDWLKYFDSNPADDGNVMSTQYGAYSHGVNSNLPPAPPIWQTTSTTSDTIALGTTTLTASSISLPVTLGQTVIIQNGSNYMQGQLVSYSTITGSMTINVTVISGSGTYSAWVIMNNPNPSPPGYTDVQIVPIEAFINEVCKYDPTNVNTGSYTFKDFDNLSDYSNSFTLYYQNNRTPKYCTVIQNYYWLFDAIDMAVDTTLQSSKTMAFGVISPTWTVADTFIPELDDWGFPLLLNEAKALAFFELKQMPHPKAEKEAGRQWSTMQKIKSVVDKPTYFEQLPSFGRRIGTGGYAVNRRNILLRTPTY